MGWVTENLSGAIDNNNRTFTISNPVTKGLSVYYKGHELEIVGSQPELLEAAYVQAGTNITLGVAPQIGDQRPWCIYFFA